MKFSVEDFYSRFDYNDNKRQLLSNFKVKNVRYIKDKDFVIFELYNDSILPLDINRDLYEYLNILGFPNSKMIYEVKDQNLSLTNFYEYLRAYSASKKGFFNTPVVNAYEDGFILSYTDPNVKDKDDSDLANLKLFLYDIGYRKDIDTYLKEPEPFVEEEREKLDEMESDDGHHKIYNYYKSKRKDYTQVKIAELSDAVQHVEIVGEIFKIDERTSSFNDNVIQIIYVKDDTGACLVKIIQNQKNTKDILISKSEVGKWYIFKGNYHFDTYQKDYVLDPTDSQPCDNPFVLVDEAVEKRVELHAHTKFSEMDGVSSPEEIVEAAYNMGHKAVAITDHLCLQGFHDAQEEVRKICKKDDPFKVIYGCEMVVSDRDFHIVYNSDNRNLSDAEYVVFDLETTGLSAEYDHIIEFGAVLMHKGYVKERKDFFIKPPFALSKYIKELTHITDENLENARTFAECKDEILDFIKDRVLVAHNATFDFGVLNAELNKLGLPKLNNTVIDTLDLSKFLFKDKKRYRLGNVANIFNVNYDDDVAHRADYDADVLAQVFNLMIKECIKKNINTIDDLNNIKDENAFIKNRGYHINILCKNETGLKNLYRLITISNTDSLATAGKSNSDDSTDDDSSFVVEPRIFKEAIDKHRDGLLIGTSCFNGEIFEIASTRSKDELAKAISYYDYIEVQPIENYRPLFEDRHLFDEERLKHYLLDIINEGIKQNKLVVATGDVHFVRSDEKILRDVCINAKAIGGVRHPLYIYNEEKRSKQVTPNQRFLNTNEMLAAFSWLEDSDLMKKIVIDNPNLIADMCEKIEPFSSDLKAPKIDDAIKKAYECNIIEEPFIGRTDVISAEQYLQELIDYKLHQKFGDNCDQLILDRVKKELDSIIGNGYGVIYYVCHLLVVRSNNDGYVVGSRGSVGSSAVAYFGGITEVNPLPPYYLCPHCHHFEWVKDIASGYDLEDKVCPECGETMKGDGQNIPFETFLGFKGDKTPDIDLNFSGDYQDKAHLFTREIFSEKNVFRAGTILKIEEKTAFGFVKGYCESMKIDHLSRAQIERLASELIGVKRTTGKHAGGIVVVPNGFEIEDVTPVQFPANNNKSSWKTTHFEYHNFEKELLKFDLLGHKDPTTMKLFEKISGIDIETIPMNDKNVLSLFYSPKALNIINPKYNEKTGAAGLPEFGTLNTRSTLVSTRPHLFSELVQICGLSHGEGVWQGNAQELIEKEGIQLKNVIGCRDDIMTVLMSFGLNPKDSFDIMENVRKKEKNLTAEQKKIMEEHGVPSWYIDSCQKITYMFPKAHAVAYCVMAVRVAWFKVYYPEYFYVSFFTLRSKQYEIETMLKDADSIYSRMKELQEKMKNRTANVNEKNLFTTLEMCYEMVSRGYRLTNIDLYKSESVEFKVNPDNHKEIIPPFIVLDGLGENVAETIIKARKERKFLSKEDLKNRTGLSTTLVDKLDHLGVLEGLDNLNQVSLF